MTRKLIRFSNGALALTEGAGLSVRIGSATIEEELDASMLSNEQRTQLISNPQGFDLHTHAGKLTGIVQRTQKKTSKSDLIEPRMKERTP